MSVHPSTILNENLVKDCDEIRTRRSGPGGQHRNKVESAVVLTHRPTGISAEANERRSQHENRRVAIFRLRVNLAIHHRSEAEPGDASMLRPSELWSGRCLRGRVLINPSHEDFPALLAEVLDTICRHGFDLQPVAEFFGCSASQLVKFLKLEPAALKLVNQHREELGLRRLR